MMKFLEQGVEFPERPEQPEQKWTSEPMQRDPPGNELLLELSRELQQRIKDSELLQSKALQHLKTLDADTIARTPAAVVELIDLLAAIVNTIQPLFAKLVAEKIHGIPAAWLPQVKK